MIKSFLSATSLACLVLVAGVAQAQTPVPPAGITPPAGEPVHTPKPGVPGEARPANQQTRIADGLESGRISGKEAARLEKQQAKIDKAQKHAEADGTVTAAERKRVRHLEQRESHQINHKLVNGKQAAAPTPAQ